MDNPYYYKDGRLYHSYNKANNKVKKGDLADKNTLNGRYRVLNINGKPVLAHRYIWEMFNGQIPYGYMVDHINNDAFDNRIENLRLATRSENGMNRKSANTNSKTGVRGVYLLPYGKYMVGCTVERKVIHIGVFEDIEEAEKAASDARLKYFGEFA